MFSFRPNISATKSWGYIGPNKPFDGLVGYLERKETDYGSSPLFVRADRGEVIDYGRKAYVMR